MGRAVLRTDGGARENPGPAAAAYVLQREDGSELSSAGKYLGEATNNVAEYEALIWGLERALDLGVRDVLVLCDSELVVRQINGHYKVKHPNMRPLFVRVSEVLKGFGSTEVRHVPRAENAAADRLVNEAIDARSFVGDEAARDVGGRGASQERLFD